MVLTRINISLNLKTIYHMYFLQARKNTRRFYWGLGRYRTFFGVCTFKIYSVYLKTCISCLRKIKKTKIKSNGLTTSTPTRKGYYIKIEYSGKQGNSLKYHKKNSFSRAQLEIAPRIEHKDTLSI